MSSLGLVVEGGGVRAIYAAGVLDVLHDACLPFDGVIGVSAGAIHGCSFVSGQKGRSLGIYKRFCKDKRFFSFRTLFRTGDIVDAKFCYHDIPQKAKLFRKKNHKFEITNLWFFFFVFMIKDNFGNITVKSLTDSIQNITVITYNLVFIIIVNYLKAYSGAFGQFIAGDALFFQNFIEC
jgi:predicted patatin/cPLA2 family phospholipase